MAYFFDQLQKNFKTIRRSCWTFANSRLLENHFVLVEVKSTFKGIQKRDPQRDAITHENLVVRKFHLKTTPDYPKKLFKQQSILVKALPLWLNIYFRNKSSNISCQESAKLTNWKTIWSASADDRGKHAWFCTPVFRIRQNSQNKKNGQT